MNQIKPILNDQIFQIQKRNPTDIELLPLLKKAAEDSIKNPGHTNIVLPKDDWSQNDGFIIIFRHGQSEDNLADKFSGWRNPDITSLGVEQASILAEKLKNLPLDIVITSDLKRSQHTAKVALKYFDNIKWELDWRIKERNYGDLMGKRKSELMQYDYDNAILYRRGYDTPPPHGESIKMVEKRVYPFLKELIERVQKNKLKVALSAHGNSMRVIRNYFEKMDYVEYLTHENPLGVDYALYKI